MGDVPTSPIAGPPDQNPVLRQGAWIVGLLAAMLGIWFIRELREAVPQAPPDVGNAATVLSPPNCGPPAHPSASTNANEGSKSYRP